MDFPLSFSHHDHDKGGYLLVKVSVWAADASPVVEGIGVAVVEPPVLIPVAFLASSAGHLRKYAMVTVLL